MKKFFVFLVVMFGVLFGAVADDKKTSGFLYSNYTSEHSVAPYVGSFVVKNNDSQQFYNGISAKLQSSLSSAFGSESLKNWFRHSLIKGEVSEYNIPDFMQIGGNYVSDFVTNKITHNIENLSYVHDINIDIKSSLGDRKWEVALDSIGAVRETDDDIILWNARGFVAQNDTGGGSAGLIYRRNFEQVLLGVNSYLDFENDGDYGSFWRYSSGIEAMGNSWDFSANVYRAITGYKTAIKSGVLSRAYSADGWDAEFNGNLPFYSQLAIGARYYKWQQKYDKNISGLVYSAELNPTNNFHFGVEYDDRQSAKGEWGVYAQYKILFGDKKSSVSASSFVAQNIDSWERRYETPTRRFAQQIVNDIDRIFDNDNGDGVRMIRPFVLQTNVLSVAVDSPLLANLTPESIDNVYNDITATVNLEFMNAASITSVITAGIVIVIPPNTNSKVIDGLFRVVVSPPTTLNGNLIVRTRQASIGDIISDGAFEIDIEILPTITPTNNPSRFPLPNSVRSVLEGSSPVLLQAGGTGIIRNRCGSGDFTYQTPESFAPAAACVVARYHPKIRVDYYVGNLYITANISIGAQFAVGVDSVVATSYRNEFSRNFAAVLVPVGGLLPVYVTPFVEAGYNVDAKGTVALGIEASYSSTINVILSGCPVVPLPPYLLMCDSAGRSSLTPSQFTLSPIVTLGAGVDGRVYVGSGLKFNVLIRDPQYSLLDTGFEAGPNFSASVIVDEQSISCGYRIDNEVVKVIDLVLLDEKRITLFNDAIHDDNVCDDQVTMTMATPTVTMTMEMGDFSGIDMTISLSWTDGSVPVRTCQGDPDPFCLEAPPCSPGDERCIRIGSTFTELDLEVESACRGIVGNGIEPLRIRFLYGPNSPTPFGPSHSYTNGIHCFDSKHEDVIGRAIYLEDRFNRSPLKSIVFDNASTGDYEVYVRNRCHRFNHLRPFRGLCYRSTANYNVEVIYGNNERRIISGTFVPDIPDGNPRFTEISVIKFRFVNVNGY